jgi:hypothetical protein
MLAWMTISGLGAAVPHAIRTANPAEIAVYQAVAERVMRIKRDTMNRTK